MSYFDKIKELRLRTSAGINAAAQALKETNGDVEKALTLLLEKGLTSARNYEDRQTKAGVVGIYQHYNNQVAGMVLLASETDFVSRMPDFVGLANSLAQHVVAMNPFSKEEFMKQQYILNPEKTVEETLLSFSSGCKEKISVENFYRLMV